jgi:hypothetical protein
MLFSAHEEALGKEIERLLQVYKQQNLKMSTSARPLNMDCYTQCAQRRSS